MKYFGKYATSGDVQTALDASALTNPYVALVGTGNTLDYNSLSPTPPAPATMGYWTQGDGTGNNPYVFHITELEETYWGTYESKIYIGEFEGDGGDSYPIYIYNVEVDGDWHVVIGEGSEPWDISFIEGESQIEYTGILTSGDSNSEVEVGWDGDFNFSFYNSEQVSTLVITTHDPEYPVGE